MRCKRCGKCNITNSTKTAHSWLVSQECDYCHFMGIRHGGKHRFVPNA